MGEVITPVQFCKGTYEHTQARLEYLRSGYSLEHNQEIVDAWQTYWDDYALVRLRLSDPDLQPEIRRQLEFFTDDVLGQFGDSLDLGDIFGCLLAIDHSAPTVRYQAASNLHPLWKLDKDIAKVAA